MLTIDGIKKISIRKYLNVRLSMFILGLAALAWFIIRVVPKPSRASYPCQRAAFPLATAFIIWIAGSIFSHSIFKKARIAFVKGNKSKALVFTFLALVVFTISVFVIQIKDNVFAAVNLSSISKEGEKLYAREMAAISEDIIEPKATVAIVRSDKAVATDITFADIDIMIRRAVEMAGGFDTLIHEGDIVVIKPNVIAARPDGTSYSNHFPINANGIATDYRVIQVVVNMVREKNSTGKIVMLEGSGYGLTRRNMDSIGYNNITGLDSIIYLDENIVQWYNTLSSTLEKVSLPTGKNLYSAANVYYLNKFYYQADVLISLPCLKSHYLTGITGSIKNVGIGATPVEMYGNGAGGSDDNLPGRWNRIGHGDFSTQTVPLDKWIHDFYLCKPVNYVIMDGLQGADYGPYPSYGRTLLSVQKNLRVILAGKDPLAVDAIESLIAGFDPYLIGHLVYLNNDTIGCINSAFIKVKGIQVHEIKSHFRETMPGSQHKYSDFAPPSNVTLTSCTLNDSEINLSLITGDDVVKVEVAYNDTILDPIVVSNFSDITVPFNKENGDTSKVSVLLYDKYLNCTRLTLENNTYVSGIVNHEIKSLNIYPNPASETVNFDLPANYKGNGTITVFSADGKMVLSKKTVGLGKQQLDISGLKNGIYYIKISFDSKNYQALLTKV